MSTSTTFDLWVEAWRQKVATGEVIVVRYADDLVAGFENRMDAEQFLKAFRERLAKFGLEVNAEKTRLIEFGRFAVQNRKQRGQGKPETFTFLGFTHYCGEATEGWHLHRSAKDGTKADGCETAFDSSRTALQDA